MSFKLKIFFAIFTKFLDSLPIFLAEHLIIVEVHTPSLLNSPKNFFVFHECTNELYLSNYFTWLINRALMDFTSQVWLLTVQPRQRHLQSRLRANQLSRDCCPMPTQTERSRRHTGKEGCQCLREDLSHFDELKN